MGDLPMSEHLEVRDLLGPYVMGALEPEEERRVEEHLESCAPCGEEVRELSIAHERLVDLAHAGLRTKYESAPTLCTLVRRRRRSSRTAS